MRSLPVVAWRLCIGVGVMQGAPRLECQGVRAGCWARGAVIVQFFEGARPGVGVSLH